MSQALASTDKVRSGSTPETRGALFGEIHRELSAGRLLVARNLLRCAGEVDHPFILWAEAAVAASSGNLALSEQLLRSALFTEPGFTEARRALATTLINSKRWTEALHVLEGILAADPREVQAGLWIGWIHAQLGDVDLAIEATRSLLGRIADDDGLVWLNLGDWLKAAGDSRGSEEAYRKAIRFAATCADGWWGLANTKRIRFEAADIGAMGAALARRTGTAAEIPLHFALAHAHEQARDFARAFDHFERGSALYLEHRPGSRSALAAQGIAAASGLHPDQFARLAGKGCAAEDPIFIIGMPRSGTTLIEQILDSHSQIEGLGELPYMSDTVASVLSNGLGQAAAIAELNPDDLRALGRRYLQLAGAHRRTAKRYFVDKMPSNWVHAGMIRLIFPRARIIDARRDPLDCCVSNYRQYFPSGHEFTYSLAALGETYRAYRTMVEHVEGLAKGAMIVAEHERFLENPEAATRALLRGLDLPYERSCLEFFNNARPVTTPSAEQVRRPISAEARGRWRNYDAWLEPLKRALGPMLRDDHRKIEESSVR